MVKLEQIKGQHQPGDKLSQTERQAVIDICNSEEFASLPSSQIVPILADRGEYIASDSSFTVFCMLKTCCITEARLKREVSIKSQPFILLKE